MSTEHLLQDVGNILVALLGTADEPRALYVSPTSLMSCTGPFSANDHLQRMTVQDPSGILLLLGQIGGLNVGGFPMDVSSAP